MEKNKFENKPTENELTIEEKEKIKGEVEAEIIEWAKSEFAPGGSGVPGDSDFETRVDMSIRDVNEVIDNPLDYIDRFIADLRASLSYWKFQLVDAEAGTGNDQLRAPLRGLLGVHLGNP